MLNVKQGSCEYQLLKSFGLTRPGNRTQVYRLRGGPTILNHAPVNGARRKMETGRVDWNTVGGRQGRVTGRVELGFHDWPVGLVK